MTNAEKYEEVFGMKVDKNMCPTKRCAICPIYKEGLSCSCADTEDWWDAEYKKEGDQ